MIICNYCTLNAILSCVFNNLPSNDKQYLHVHVHVLQVIAAVHLLVGPIHVHVHVLVVLMRTVDLNM